MTDAILDQISPKDGPRVVDLPTPEVGPPRPPRNAVGFAQPARPKGRHFAAAMLFVILVATPSLLWATYLWTRAADQFASFVAFSVRTEETGSAIELLGGITEISGSSSSDTDILYDFLQSQALVRRLDDALGLRAIWSRVPAEVDPFFAYHAPGTIEDLVAHWRRMVQIGYDSATGLIDVRVLAFDPVDAQRIAGHLQAQSSEMINALSAVAREDAIGYARDEAERAEARLAAARVAMTAFRNRTQIVDPTIDTQGQMGLVTNLQAQLAAAMIDLDMLRDTTRDSDPRVAQAERRISVIEARIEAERAVIGADGGGRAFADLVDEYERLAVDLAFAQEAYTAARAGYDLALSDAQRQSRYLAAHIEPTLAEAAQFPQRAMYWGLLTGFLLLSWLILVLVGYALRDRR